MLELDFDRVIPGHGPVTDRAGLRAFQTFMRQLAQVGEQAARSGLVAREDDAARRALDADAGYEVMAIPFVLRLDRDFVVRRAWEEATRQGRSAIAAAGGREVKQLFSIEGKVALVTGGSRGIGLMIARGYAEAARRSTSRRASAEACDATAAELSKVGTCVALPADLSTAGRGAARSPASSPRASRALHILVNNAGANWGAPLEEYPDAALGQGARAEREGGLPPHAWRSCRSSRAAAHARRPGARDQHRLDRRHPGAAARDLRLLGQQGRVHHLTRVLARKLARATSP